MKGADLIPGEVYAVSRGRKLNLGDAGAWRVVFVGRGYIEKNDFTSGKKIVVAQPKPPRAKDTDGGFAVERPVFDSEGKEVGREWRPLVVPYKNVLGTWEDHEAAEVLRKEREARNREAEAAKKAEDQIFGRKVKDRLAAAGLSASIRTGDGWGNRQRQVIFEGTDRIEALLAVLEAS